MSDLNTETRLDNIAASIFATLNLLIQKGIITKEEYMKMYEEEKAKIKAQRIEEEMNRIKELEEFLGPAGSQLFGSLFGLKNNSNPEG